MNDALDQTVSKMSLSTFMFQGFTCETATVGLKNLGDFMPGSQTHTIKDKLTFLSCFLNMAKMILPSLRHC